MTPEAAKAVGYALDAIEKLGGIVERLAYRDSDATHELREMRSNIKLARELIATAPAFEQEGLRTAEEDER